MSVKCYPDHVAFLKPVVSQSGLSSLLCGAGHSVEMVFKKEQDHMAGQIQETRLGQLIKNEFDRGLLLRCYDSGMFSRQLQGIGRMSVLSHGLLARTVKISDRWWQKFNHFMPLLKAHLILKLPGPNPKFSEYMLERGQYIL